MTDDSGPDAPDLDPIRNVGYDVKYHDQIESTNDRAREMAREGVDHAVVLANAQTAGRGRLDRDWSGPPGGIYLSIVLDPDLDPEDVPVLTLATAVGVARAARRRGVEAGIKWPNDVQVEMGDGDGEDGEERKLAGILTERVDDRVVIGVGVNANVDPGDLPERATTLQATAGEVDRGEFVADILTTLEDLRGDPDAAVSAWRDLATTLDREVRVETPVGAVEGRAVDVERPGRLVVQTDDGTRKIEAGDCEHLRPTE